MRNLPPILERFLASLGVNTMRLKWKLHFWEEALKRKRKALTARSQGRRYKSCRRCGQLALAEDKICKCGHRLPSYAVYRIGRALAFERPEFGVVSVGFLLMIVSLFALQVGADGARALMRPSIQTLVRFGAFKGELLLAGQYWRILTMALVHSGILHIGFNALALSQMLPRFEDEIGPWRASILITLTQAAAALAHTAWYPPYGLTSGASGVAFGLIGFGLARAVRSGNSLERGFFLQWFLYGVAFGVMMPGIDNAAHGGGFLAGLALGYWIAGREPRGAMKRAIQLAGGACLILWIASVGFLLVSIVKG